MTVSVVLDDDEVVVELVVDVVLPSAIALEGTTTIASTSKSRKMPRMETATDKLCSSVDDKDSHAPGVNTADGRGCLGR